MILISHRGNLSGPKPELENNPKYILAAISCGFDVECDIRLIDDKLFLGHDEAQYEIPIDFLLKNKSKLWIHCKNLSALSLFFDKYESKLNYFWHENDAYTLTSFGYIWGHPNSTFNDNVIIVSKNRSKKNKYMGICSDYIQCFIK